MDSVGAWVKNSLNETRDFIGSTVEGANSAFKHAGPETGPAFSQAVRHSWAAAAIGACIGVAGGIVNDDRKPARGAVVGGFLGAAVGLSAGIAWNARSVISAIADSAAKNAVQLRDAHWLARHPIDYA
jgi:hypothetical protein